MPRTGRLPTLTDMDLLAGPPLLAWVRPPVWRAADRAAAVVYGVAAALLLAKHAHGVLALAGAVTAAVAVAWPVTGRRRSPLGAFAVAAAAVAALALWQPRSVAAGLVPLGYVLYAVAARSRPRAAVLALLAALAAAAATALPDFRHLGAAALFGPLYITVWTIGYAVGMHRRYTSRLVRGQAQLARAQVDQARRELIEQRITIAREVHDVVAHHMSVITVQAGYGGLLLDEAADPRATARARDALAVIETTGRQALDEMRRLVSVLRAADAGAREYSEPGSAAAAAGLVPAPGLDDLPRLLGQASNAGVEVELTTTGNARPLPPGEDLAAYRIIQEALTNVMKHSGAAAARVHLGYGEDKLTIDVADEGPANGRPAAPVGLPRPGRGLAGMRERAQLYGGDLRAALTDRGGFRVTARLPLPACLAPAGQAGSGARAPR
jgi:signal transduction histidine kinase